MQDASQTRSLRQRWEDYQCSKTQTFWIAVAAVVATLIAGFGFAGWVTGGTAKTLVEEASAKSRQELAAAICVEEFMAAADAGKRLKNLKSKMWYERDDIVAATGWATMPDRKEPSIVLAELCASELAEIEMPVDPKKVSLGATQ